MFVVSRMALIPVVAPHYNNKITTTETGQFHDYFSLRIAADRFGSDQSFQNPTARLGPGPASPKPYCSVRFRPKRAEPGRTVGKPSRAVLLQLFEFSVDSGN